MPGTRLAERLQDLLLDNDVLEDFLRQLSGLAAEFASAETGRPMLCSVRVDRRRQQMLLAASHPEARTLDGLQDHVGEGPGLEARQTGRAVMVPDTTMDPRWRRYQRAAAQRGSRSILAVSLLADRDAAATLTFFSTSPEAFDDGAMAACGVLAARAAQVTRLAIRLESAQGMNRDLLQALRSRTEINLATGILMAQSRCSQSEALALLARVSNTRNVKLRIVAREILRRFDGGPAGTAFST
ncbi:GAF domain-containing protein [Arthrobacter ginsengisoli]|uniref:GAF domain-containing protein n=1 Tax=Arthrobacter ginsengisoli TaxID=1356565 RepID=A0ABU1U9D5_9MICC|nr:GAF and ANTAR domain-containing protein [Arthrobacter ginsengisoli]MDR7081777.1 GAF domain-containing protein [Arthrobacter ginsengisoli]